MMRVGLTGGIGSGKSLIARIFSTIGIPVFEADGVSRKIMAENDQVRKSLISWFGNEIYAGGEPDRKALAGILFNDAESLARVNNMLHPLVLNEFISWCGRIEGSPYVIHEAAILFETGFYKYMDYNILVTAPVELRIKRIMDRDHTTREKVLDRMKNQWPEEDKIPLADFLITNDGMNSVISKILEIHNYLISKTND